MNRTIAITGATGFIGGALVKRLTSAGFQVRALVRPASMNKLPENVPAEWIAGDLDDVESLERLISGVDAVVHCAGAVRGSVQMDFDRINVDGVEQLVKVAASQDSPPRFLLLSSLAAREPQLSYYAGSKFKGEGVLVSNARDMCWGIFRPPAVYGPGDREMLPLFQWMLKGIAPLIGSEQNRVSLLYIEDLVEAILSWLLYEAPQKHIFELHDGHPCGYSWREIIGVVEDLGGKSIRPINIPVSFVKGIAWLNLGFAKIFNRMPMLTPGKVRELIHPDWVVANDQLSREIGWNPQFSLEKGLKQTLGL